MRGVPRGGRLVALWLLAALGPAAVGMGSTAEAQTTSRPGPWTFDLRGVTSPVPDDPVFYPNLVPSALVPDRGFGIEAGAHVYLLNIGASRIGIGASLFAIRSITEPAPAPETPPASGQTPPAAGQSVQVDLRMLTPQISFNFGTGDGWSYLSAGAGRTGVVTRTTGAIAGRREAEPVTTLNVGGGARWFIKSHFGVGFDIRFHMIGAGTAGAIEQTSPPLLPPLTPSPPTAPAATPSLRLLTISGGFSFK